MASSFACCFAHWCCWVCSTCRCCLAWGRLRRRVVALGTVGFAVAAHCWPPELHLARVFLFVVACTCRFHRSRRLVVAASCRTPVARNPCIAVGTCSGCIVGSHMAIAAGSFAFACFVGTAVVAGRCTVVAAPHCWWCLVGSILLAPPWQWDWTRSWCYSPVFSQAPLPST